MTTSQIAITAWEIVGIVLVAAAGGAFAMKLWFITLGHGDWSAND